MSNIEERLSDFRETFGQVESEISKVIVGQKDIIRGTLGAIFSGGHVLLEGVPGLGKTLLVNSIARALGLNFKRIQFTPDLMPSDITGTEILNEGEDGQKQFVFMPGPLFANIILADEINRATAKTQAALLEAMEEKQITVMGKTHPLQTPFFVLATQNPVELEGTYPLPEAQLDRFMIKLVLKLPSEPEMQEILTRTTGSNIPLATPVIEGFSPAEKINDLKSLVREVVVPKPLQEVLVRMLSALNPDSNFATEKVKKYVRFGSGPRGAQATVLFSKVMAILAGRMNIDFVDLQSALVPCLRHRLILNFQAEAEGITAEEIISEIVKAK